MTSSRLLNISYQINTLSRRDRLRLLWQILKSFLFSTRFAPSPQTPPAFALEELQQICAEENYTLEVPRRFDRENFSLACGSLPAANGQAIDP